MLYDRVHDNIIPGETLLTMKDMENHTYKEKKKGCSFNVIYGDSTEDKSTVFKGDANLELNFLKGAAAVGASGKFLSNTSLKKNELRVSLTAEYIMLYKELEMKPFKLHISSTKTTATHIVTAIEYGACVTFTFDRTISENEDILEISGELKGMVEKIPSLKASGNLKGSMGKSDKNKTDKVSCKFCGDVILQENPTTYEDAVKCYKELPSYLTEDEAVPVTVWLYPIPKMSTPATNILQTINKEKKKHVIIALEDLQKINVSCNGLMWQYAYTMHLFQKLNTRSISLLRMFNHFKRTSKTKSSLNF
ncbi:stonustoxin subunit alpha-like [Mytilus trossulus]|uniref:stonustoxin subunit alpha-like n=1 Tax=Mytilus trossulus TaxID=6551 RepID=UPI0030056D8A